MNGWARRGLLFPLALAALLPAPAAAAAHLTQVSARVIEIAGDEGAWRLTYGATGMDTRPRLVAGEPGRGWFVHGTWLRLLDTRRGLVLGRWRLPAEIEGIVPRGSAVELELRRSGRFLERRSLLLDPAHPFVPNWTGWGWFDPLLPICEARYISSNLPGVWCEADVRKRPPEQARALVAEAEDIVRRDAFSPWLQVMLGKLLRDAGDARWPEAFRAALAVPEAEPLELFRISLYFERLNEPDLARQAFDHAYTRYLERGNEPRLFFGWPSLFYSLPRPAIASRFRSDHGTELMERVYRIAPYGAGAELAWRMVADSLERNGLGEQARVWRERAADARDSSPYVLTLRLSFIFNQALLALIASVIASVTFLLLTSLRYLPETKMEWQAAQPGDRRAAALSWLPLRFWTRKERLAFACVVLAGWLATGVVEGLYLGVQRFLAAPIAWGMGVFAGPESQHYLRAALPASPARTLLEAFGYDKEGDGRQAEALYRSVPRYAEAWNNLGVLLHQAGREAEARQAYEQALRLKPGMPEASLNLGRRPNGYWAELHSRYLPGRPMPASVSRELMTTAFFGMSLPWVLARAPLGPFAGLTWARPTDVWVYDDPTSLITGLALVTAVLGPLAVALLVFLPHERPLEPPLKGQRYWLALFPGAAPAWGVVGGLVLAAWYFVLAHGFMILRGEIPEPAPLVGGFQIGWLLQSSIEPADFARLLYPNRTWLVIAPAVLLLVNLVVLWRERRPPVEELTMTAADR